LFYNCDGLRLAEPEIDLWAGVGVMPGYDSNVDVRLHDPSTGSKDGFAANLVYSGWGPEQSDFVLVNFFQTDPQDFDVGVLNIAGDEDYTLNAVVVQDALGYPDGTYGPFLANSGEFLHLYYIPMNADSYTFRLNHVYGNVDWGMSLYSPEGDFFAKSDAVDGGIAWQNGEGEDEEFNLEIAGGPYCLAVWKVSREDIGASGAYEIEIVQGVTGIEETPDLPRVTCLKGIHPNPFNPQTTVSFDLAAPARVEVAVYDLKGARVRSLVTQHLPAGRHKAVWDGRNDAGGKVASGVYFARMVAGEVKQVRKMVLVK